MCGFGLTGATCVLPTLSLSSSSVLSSSLRSVRCVICEPGIPAEESVEVNSLWLSATVADIAEVILFINSSGAAVALVCACCLCVWSLQCQPSQSHLGHSGSRLLNVRVRTRAQEIGVVAVLPHRNSVCPPACTVYSENASECRCSRFIRTNDFWCEFNTHNNGKSGDLQQWLVIYRQI